MTYLDTNVDTYMNLLPFNFEIIIPNLTYQIQKYDPFVKLYILNPQIFDDKISNPFDMKGSQKMY